MSDDNLRRARHARHALAAFQEVADTGNEEEALSDLIADLGHYADRHDIDFLDCCSRAIAGWALERKGAHAAEKSPDVVIQIGGAP